MIYSVTSHGVRTAQQNNHTANIYNTIFLPVFLPTSFLILQCAGLRVLVCMMLQSITRVSPTLGMMLYEQLLVPANLLRNTFTRNLFV